MATPILDWLNIALMAVSCLLAFHFPFHLFLFSFAVLGPLHYFTELPWLKERAFFATGKYDYLVLVGAACFAGACHYLGLYPGADLSWLARMLANFLYIAFFSSLAMTMVKNVRYKIVAFVLIAASTVLASRISPYTVLFADLLPTIVHVHLFTACFILYGALRSRSSTGYLSLAVFLLCTFLIFAVAPAEDGDRNLPLYIRSSYALFAGLNVELLNFLGLQKTTNETPGLGRIIFMSDDGIVVMRLIAFSYTYHYLNWFSKTSIIKWHKIPKRSLAMVLAFWIASLALYAYNFTIGIQVLFLVSLLHVMLEFPLNQRTFVGIAKELWTTAGRRR